jgi:PAP2 superfamily
MSFLTTQTTHTTHTTLTTHGDGNHRLPVSELSIAEGLTSSLIGLNHWDTDSQDRAVAATPLRAGARAGFSGANTLPASAEQRFFGTAALPRAYVCNSELMDQVQFKQTTADTGSIQTRSGKVIVEFTRPNFGTFAAQLVQLHQLSCFRARRAAEILPQVYPADAWWASMLGLRPDRYRATLEFLDVALNFTVTVVFRFKQMFGCPRPFEYSAAIQPLVTTPGHDSWPSGHATESFLQARILATLSQKSFEGDASAETLLLQNAERIARNREIAGVHFPADSVAGCILGDTLARFIISYSADDATGKALTRKFDAAGYYKGDPNKDESLVDRAGEDTKISWSAFPTQQPHHAYMQWMWARAQAEWL